MQNVFSLVMRRENTENMQIDIKIKMQYASMKESLEKVLTILKIIQQKHFYSENIIDLTLTHNCNIITFQHSA